MPHIAHSQISSCTFGTSQEFNNNASIIFTQDSTNSRLFTSQSIQNGITFDFSILDNSPPNRLLGLPITGNNHNQDGGTATNGAIQLLAAVGDTTADVDVTINISGGFVTEIEFYSHDIEDDETVIFGTLDYLPDSLAAHPGATVGINAATAVAQGTAANTDSSSNRSAVATYQNINGVSTVSQNFAVVNGRIGGGVALGTYCQSSIEAKAELFTAIQGILGGNTETVLTSDILNGDPVSLSNITLTSLAINGPDGNPSTAITLNANGTVTVPPGTSPGAYSVEYEICDIVNTGNCDSVIETITVEGLPAILPVKTVEMFENPGNANYAIPGNDVIYTITIKNIGDGSTDSDSIKIIDAMPPEVSFWNGDIDFGGDDNFPDITPVAFQKSASAEITFIYETDIKFGFGTIAPSDFESCSSLTPDNSYRDDVNFICFNPKGVLNAASPSNSFSLSFRAQIN